MKAFHKRKTVDGVENLSKISKSTLLVLEEAEKHGIQWETIPCTNLFKLSYKDEERFFYGQIPSETTAFAYYCCKDKRVARNLLEQAGISVAKGFLIKPSDEKAYREELFDSLQKPLVVKPVSDMQGNNVHLNISTKAEYFKAITDVYEFYGEKEVDLLVEEMFSGVEYRILATPEKVLSIIQRIPANVTGDGSSTIQELIAAKNADPLRQELPTYKEIAINDALQKHLRSQKLELQSILPKGKQVFLLPHGPHDISQGGDTVDVTDRVHNSVTEIAISVVKSIPGLALTGIDFMTKDIFAQQTAESYRIIEINASPSLDWNQYPLQGEERNITYDFLKTMFQNLEQVE